LGIRVPFLLVSPWIEKGVVEHDPLNGPFNTSKYNHASIPATLRKIFGTRDFLTLRDAWSPTFEHLLLTRSTPRTDCPLNLPPVPPISDDDRELELSRGMNSLQCDFVRGLEFAHGDCAKMSQVESGVYLRKMMMLHKGKYSSL